MEFIQGLFLIGAASFAIPIAIHMIFRLRKKRLVFSSLRFLKESMLRDSRRMRLRDLILLLLRCAALILIALAFARPYRLGQALAGPGSSPRQDLILILDDSPSLAAQENSVPRWERILEKARKNCHSRKPGDRVALVLSSDPGRAAIELSGNFGAVLAALRKDHPSAIRGNLLQATRTGLSLISESTAPDRRILVLSDWQANQIDRGAWDSLASEVAQMTWPPVLDLQAPDKSTPKRLTNIAISGITPRSDVWVENRPITFAVRIQNHGSSEVNNLAIRLVADQKVQAQRIISLNPFGTAEVELKSVFTNSGAATGHVEIEAHDALPSDDRRLFAIQLRDNVKTLIVEDSLRDAVKFLDRSYFLRMALNPKRPDTPSNATGSRVSVRAIRASNVNRKEVEATDIIFLASVTSLSPQSITLLEETIQAGGNLVLFLDPSKDATKTFYNQHFWKKGKGLLSARIESKFEGDLSSEKFNGLDSFKATHPIFEVFAQTTERDLRKPKYTQTFRLKESDITGADSGKRPNVLARFNDGSPFLVEHTFGRGRVLLFPFVPTAETTDLIKRKVFVPLIHQVVRYLSGVEKGSSLNLIVGQSINFSELKLSGASKIKFSRPAPHNDTLDLYENDSITADYSGIYSASLQLDKLTSIVKWAANADPLESNLNPEDLEGLRALFTSNQTPEGKAGTAEEAKRAKQVLKAQSPEILKKQASDWRLYLAGAIFCLLLEVAVRDFW